ncbi:MAG: RrF2 family transcriptional regulator [Lachnospiraceae bacterium]|nr:RrF2 family transcriptional regulator [Lachnospiraceae bacterium]
MKISTRGRYAVRVMLDLAEHDNGTFIPLMDIAKRQEISEKYLESIVSTLSKNHFVVSLRGKGGGYRLARRPEEYTIGSILKVTEGSLAPVACLEEERNSCPRMAECKTLKLWEDFDRLVDDYFEGITLADLENPNLGADNYVI